MSKYMTYKLQEKPMTDLPSAVLTGMFQGLIEIWWIIPLLIIVTYFKSASFKGKSGEAFVNSAINRKLDKASYHLIKDVTLPTANGTTQIDHIIVSRFGIFVIETKNMKGWIFGGERQKTWTQTIYKNKTKFQNPLHQNYKHIKTLEDLLGLSSDKFHSVVVFVGESTFKTKMPNNVLKGGYTDYIKSKNEEILAYHQVLNTIEQIESNKYDRGYKTNRKHVKNLKKNH